MVKYIKQAPTDRFMLGQELQYFENAEITTEIPLKNGRIPYTLTDEEKKLVESHYGLELDNPEHINLWLEKVTFETKPTIDVIDDTNPEHILKKGILLANNTYAPNLEAANDYMQGYKFVVYDEEQEAENKATLYEKYDEAIIKLGKLRKRKKKLLAVAKYILPSTTGIQSNVSKAYTLLRDWIDGKFDNTSRREAIDALIRTILMDEAELYVTVDFKEAYKRNIIRTDTEGYFINAASGTRLGKNQAEAITYLMNPKNQDELGMGKTSDKPYSIRYQLEK